MATTTGARLRRWWHGPNRTDALVLGGLLVVFLALHGAWFTNAPGDLDAFNFSLGVRDFDVTRHRPHPPGAPVYIAAGKAATWLWETIGLPTDEVTGVESAALAGLSLVAGALSIFLTFGLVQRLDPGTGRARRAALLFGTAPLVWLLAMRPLSDVLGLTAVLAVGWLLASGRLGAGALLAGLAAGLRIQTALLTLPALAIVFWRQRSVTTAGATVGGYAGGVLTWLVPLVVASGGPRRYWTAVTAQAADDMTSPIILAATPTTANATNGLFNTFVRPWGGTALACLMLVAAAIGVVYLFRTNRRGLAVLGVCVLPYALFHVVFQETATVRYALPLVAALVYLAASAVEAAPAAARSLATAALVLFGLAASLPAMREFGAEGGPATGLLRAMYARAVLAPPAFITGHWNLMIPQLQGLIPSPPWTVVEPNPGHEWQGTIDHWMAGDTTPVWFVADPAKRDESQFDRRARRLLGLFSLKEPASWLLNGMRPKALAWWELSPPTWIATKGFALTPEIGGQAAARGEGPARHGAQALVRRFGSGSVLAVGGRHVGAASSTSARIFVEIDGRRVWTGSASPASRRYSALVHLSPEQLDGVGTYATATIRSLSATDSTGVPVTVEDFDFQPAEGAVMALTTGWHEPELEPVTGRAWRWTKRRARLKIHRAGGVPVVLSLDGAVPPEAPVATVEITADGQIVESFEADGRFERTVVLPPAQSGRCDVDVTISSSFAFAPHDLDPRTPDGRELALKVYDIHVSTAPRGAMR